MECKTNIDMIKDPNITIREYLAGSQLRLPREQESVVRRFKNNPRNEKKVKQIRDFLFIAIVKRRFWTSG